MKKYREPSAAYYLGCSAYTLQKWRQQGKGPKFRKVGRNVVYYEEDLISFLDDNTFNSTSEYGGVA